MKIRRTQAIPKPLRDTYTYTHNRHMAALYGTQSLHVALKHDDIAFARLFSDRGTISGGIRRALDQARLRCGTCKCCKKVTVNEPDYSARMYPSNLL